MARHIADQKAEQFVAVREDYTEVTANRTRRTIISFDRDVVPHEAPRRE
jgi:hypothetical protein